MKSKIKIWASVVLAVICLGGLFVYWQYFPHNEVDINVELTQLSKNSEWSLGSIDIGEEWDSVMIAKPYDETIYEHVDMMNGDRRELDWTAMLEGYCSLIFLKDNKLVAFSSVNRALIDFSTTKNSIYPKDAHFAFVKNKVYEIEE